MELNSQVIESLTTISQASRDDILGCWFATIEIVLKSLGKEPHNGEVFAIAAHQVADLKNSIQDDSIFNPDFHIN